jgi:hypothetical protein
VRKEVAEKCPESRFDISDVQFSGCITVSSYIAENRLHPHYVEHLVNAV